MIPRWILCTGVHTEDGFTYSEDKNLTEDVECPPSACCRQYHRLRNLPPSPSLPTCGSTEITSECAIFICSSREIKYYCIQDLVPFHAPSAVFAICSVSPNPHCHRHGGVIVNMFGIQNSELLCSNKRAKAPFSVG